MARKLKQFDPEHVSPAPLAEALGVEFIPELLEQALTHSSYGYEQQVDDYERLEFLGDSVLSLAVATMLYRANPGMDEGELSKLHHTVVSELALAEVARTYDIGTYLRLGRSEVLSGGEDKDSILADAVEALIGAAYLSAGHDVADALVQRLIAPILADVSRFAAASDPKTALEEALAARGGGVQSFVVTGEGPHHDRVFTAELSVVRDGRAVLTTTGTGRSKKQAELAAALIAWCEVTGTPHPTLGRPDGPGDDATAPSSHGAAPA